MKNCAFCCKENEDSAAHCEWCGMAMGGVARVSETDLQDSRGVKKCSYCGRENEGGAANCGECGTPLENPTSRAEIELDPALEANRRMISGAVWCIAGIAITTVTFVSAVNSPSGGIYVITWGAIIFGAKQFLKGYFQGWCIRRTKNMKASHEVAQEGIRSESGIN